MDNRITKIRLKQLLSYDLIKIIAIILGGVLIWSLLFTIFGDSLEEGQSLNIYSYNVVIADEELDRFLLGDDSDYKSYETKAVTYYNFGFYSASDTVFGQQFTAWNGVGQLDIMFVSDGDDREVVSTDSSGQEVKTYYSLFDDYCAYFADLEALVKKAKDYCMAEGGYTADGTPNTEKIKSHFYKRKKGDNFLRHGLINADMEIERFAKIWEAATRMEGWLNDENVDIWKVGKDYNGNEKIYGIDMGKLSGKDGRYAHQLCSYNKQEGDGDTTAANVVLAIMNNAEHQGELTYESLAFAVKVVSCYSTL